MPRGASVRCSRAKLSWLSRSSTTSESARAETGAPPTELPPGPEPWAWARTHRWKLKKAPGKMVRAVACPAKRVVMAPRGSMAGSGRIVGV